MARIKRRLPQALVAERAGISLATLRKLENGDMGVSIGIVATVLFALGLGKVFEDIVDPSRDALGIQLDEERLPKRVRLPKTCEGER